MKIAVPTSNGYQISGHFGRTPAFKIIEIDENNKVVAEKIIQNDFTGHARGEHHEHDENQAHQQHSHSRILANIGDCDVVIAGGMGRRLYDDLINHGIKVYVTQENSISLAVEKFIKDELDNNPDGCCQH